MASHEDTLEPINDDEVWDQFLLSGESADLNAMNVVWKDFDPEAEPLDVQVLSSSTQDGVLLQVIRYRVGCFKGGKKVMMAGIYGRPLNEEEEEEEEVEQKALYPGLVHVHGGGQFAHYNVVKRNAQRGYATLTIAWAGRILGPNSYLVGAKQVRQFWNQLDDETCQTKDPVSGSNEVLVTTDWGPLDGYHSPSRYGNSNVQDDVQPYAWTIDSTASPRNTGWFLWTMAARRALTFLEQRPEIDPNRLGVYGHSMGGKISIMTAALEPHRVKVVAPSCGGISHPHNTHQGRPAPANNDNYKLLANTIGDKVYLRHIQCPVLFQCPSNDFHAFIQDLPLAINDVQTGDWQLSCSPYHDHQDSASYEVVQQLWMDQYLKPSTHSNDDIDGEHWLSIPAHHVVKLILQTPTPHVEITVQHNAKRRHDILSVDTYYTQQFETSQSKRFWHYAPTIPSNTDSNQDEETQQQYYTARLPLETTTMPLWVYCNVKYALHGAPIRAAGYYHGDFIATDFVLSSLIHSATAPGLQSAGIEPTMDSTLMIERFQDDDAWQKEWFTYDELDNNDSKMWKTHWKSLKINSSVYRAPRGKSYKLVFMVLNLSTHQQVMTIGLDGFVAEVQLDAQSDSNKWQQISLEPTRFRDINGKSALHDFSTVSELRIGPNDQLRSGDGMHKIFGTPEWQGPMPKFKDLCWSS